MRSYHVKWKGRMWVEMLLAEWFRGSPAPWRVLPHRCSLLQDYMSTRDPFVALSATAKAVPVVCGAENVFSRGAGIWTAGWVPKSIPDAVWDSWVRMCSRDATGLVISTAGTWLSPGQLSGAVLLGGLQNTISSSVWEFPLHVKQTPWALCLLFHTTLRACGAHCFEHGCVPLGWLGYTAMTNVNSSNSFFCVCLICKMSSVLCQRQWWAVLSLPVFSGHGCSILAQYQGFCHEEPEAGRHGGCPFSRSWWVQHCWTSDNPEGRDCPSTATSLGAFLMLMSGWMALFCRSQSGTKAYSLDRMAGSSGGGTAGSSSVIPSSCWWKTCACSYFCSGSVLAKLVLNFVACSGQYLPSL